MNLLTAVQIYFIILSVSLDNEMRSAKADCFFIFIFTKCM